MCRFYKPSLWIPQHFLFTNPNLHHGLLSLQDLYPRRSKQKESVSRLRVSSHDRAEGHGISFASEDCVQYPEATQSGDVVQDTVNLEIHLIKRLLHVQDLLCRHLDQTAAVSPESR